MQLNSSEKILLIGWDAADWDIINPLIAEHKMPNLQKLINNGSSGTLETLQPVLSPMLWTSIATGKTANKHGVLGFVEPDLETGNPRPVSVNSRQCKTVWNILSQQQIKTNVIGWWPSHPAEPINGVSVSNLFTKNDTHQPVISNSVYPIDWENQLLSCRVFAENISLQELSSFVPEALSINQNTDKHLHNLAALLANAKSIQQLAKKIITQTTWNFTAVYFDVIDQICHTFMKFHPPQMIGVPDEYYQLYQRVVTQMYIYHDAMLGELLDLVGEETTVMVLSDHGFYANHLRPIRLPNDPASPSLEHSPFGMLCIKGKYIKTNYIIKGASLLDITPTILQLFSLPTAKDMDGAIISSILKNNVTINPIESWENVISNTIIHSSENNQQSWQSATAMFQLMELGYIQKFETNKEQTIKKIIHESHYYLAIVLMSLKQYEEAYALLLPLYQDNSATLRYSLKLVACLQLLQKPTEAKNMIDGIKVTNAREIPPTEILDALFLSSINGHQEALDLFLEIGKNTKHVPQLYIYIGNEYVNLKYWSLAEAAFLKALELQPNHTQALCNLIFVLKQLNKPFVIFENTLNLLSKINEPNFTNTFDKLNELDFNNDRTIDFRKYQLIIRLFLEQFHKGIKHLK